MGHLSYPLRVNAVLRKGRWHCKSWAKMAGNDLNAHNNDKQTHRHADSRLNGRSKTNAKRMYRNKKHISIAVYHCIEKR